MSLPRWAPPELAALLESMEGSKNAFRAEAYKWDKSDLKKHAQRLGFPSWHNLESCLTLQETMLKRLLTHEEARVVWNVLNGLPHRGGRSETWWQWRHAELAVAKWYQRRRQPAATRRDELKKIAELARSLAFAVEQYSGNGDALTVWGRALGDDDVNRLRRVLNPEFLKIVDGRIGVRGAASIFLPDMGSLLARLADVADIEANTRAIGPRKVGAATAFRTYLIDQVMVGFLGAGFGSANGLNAHVARFVSVALEDDTVTADTVRKSAPRKITAE